MIGKTILQYEIIEQIGEGGPVRPKHKYKYGVDL